MKKNYCCWAVKLSVLMLILHNNALLWM
jgi:hypothetical protein